MKLTAYEKETILLFNEEEEMASVYTHNAKMKERLKSIAKEHPEACHFERTNGAGGVTYSIDKKLISIRAPYSEARKQKIREWAISQRRVPPGNKKQQRNKAQKSE